jgi:hypothetical protein
MTELAAAARRPIFGAMARHGNVKDDEQYEALRRKGMSKTRAAKITNAGKKAQKKGGMSSGKKAGKKAGAKRKTGGRKSSRGKRRSS